MYYFFISLYVNVSSRIRLYLFLSTFKSTDPILTTQQIILIQLQQFLYRNFPPRTTVMQNKLLLEIRNIYSCRHHACNLYVYLEKSKTCLARDILLQKSDAKKIIFFHLRRSHSEYKVCIIRTKKNIRASLTHTHMCFNFSILFLCISATITEQANVLNNSTDSLCNAIKHARY